MRTLPAASRPTGDQSPVEVDGRSGPDKPDDATPTPNAWDPEVLGRVIPTVAFRLAADGTILMRSGSGLAKLGQVDGDGVGHHAGDFWHDAPQIREAVQRALSGERVSRRIQASSRVFQVDLVPWLDDRGLVRDVSGVALDVTEQVDVERSLSDLAAFPLHNPNPVIEIGRSGEVRRMNPCAAATFPDLSDDGADHPILRGLVVASGGADPPSGGYVGSHGRVFLRHAVAEADSIRVYLTDITEQRQAEDAVWQLAEHQSAIAKIGTLALSGVHLDAVFEEVANVLAELLAVDLTGVMLLDEQETRLTLAAGSGWSEGVVGSTIDLGSCHADLTFEAPAPVVKSHRGIDHGLHGLPLLRQHGVASSLSAALRSSERALGALCAHSRSRRDFSHEEQTFLQALANVVGSTIERHRSAEALRHQALHDSLTGLANRALLIDHLELALARLDRSGGTVAVLFLDLDGFKHVNDGLGHAAGDGLLVEVARRLSAVMRGTDTVARFGGDEFVVVCELDAAYGRSEAAAARTVANNILEVFDEPLAFGDGDVHLSASIGIALCSASTGAAEDLVSDADAAMYRAKEHGRGRYSFASPDERRTATGRWEVERNLRKAVDDGSLTVHYMPAMELASGRIIAAEALVRWEHSEFGPVPPATFIPIAEDTGLILPIGRFVLDRACTDSEAWRASNPGAPMVIAVNVSVEQLKSDQQFLASVVDTLDRTGCSPDNLALEITESVIMSDVESVRRELMALRALGVRLGVDDFGTGYSSLSRLHQLPLDALKIDRSFVAGLGVDEKDTEIVTAVINLAHALKLGVIAEGVETADQLAHLTDLGCDMAQGYLIGRPMPSTDFLSMWQRCEGNAVAVTA